MKQLVFAVRDVDDRGVWSGTPANMARALRDAGWTVTGIDADVTGRAAKALALIDYLRGRFGLWSVLRHPRRAAAALAGDARSAFRRMPLYRRLACAALSRRLARQTPGPLIHFSTFPLPVRGPARAWPQLLVIDSTWALTAPLSDEDHHFSPRQMRSAELWERRALAEIDHFLVIGEHVGRSLRDNYGIAPDRITAIGTGSGGIAPFTGAKDYRNGQILFCAKHRLNEKGLWLLLDAFALARAHRPDLKLILVGHPDFPEIAADRPGVEGMGAVSWDELQRLFGESSLFAMPALHEPWGLVYLEALVSRMPLLLLDRLAAPELTGGGRYGFLVERPDPTAVAQALIDAFADPLRLKCMGQAALAAVSAHYTWPKVAERVGAAVEAATQEKGKQDRVDQQHG